MNTINISDIANVVFNGFDVEKLVINNDVVWELSKTPEVCLVAFNASGAPIVSALSGEAAEDRTAWIFNKDICDFEEISITAGTALTGLFTKHTTDTPVCYMVCCIEGTKANMFDATEVTIPSEYNGLPVIGVAPNAFKDDTTIQKIKIQEGIEYIGEDAFKNCTALQTIELPESLLTVYSSAFDNTGYFNNDNNFENGLLIQNNVILSSKEDISTVNIGENIVGMAFNSFAGRPVSTINYNAIRLRTPKFKIYRAGGTVARKLVLDNGTTLPTSYGTCSEGYFRKDFDNVDSSSLIPEIPEATLNIGANVKQAPFALWVSGNQGMYGSGGKTVKGGISNITPDFLTKTNITELAPHCVMSPRGGYVNYELATTKDDPLIIPKQITSVAPRACAGYYHIEYFRVDCDVLSEMMFANLNPEDLDDAENNVLTSNIIGVNITGRPTEIPNKCFYICNSLTDINIPDSVTKLGDYCFYYNTALKTITLPNSIQSIGGRAFQLSSALTSIIIPSSVKTIGEYAFASCTALTTVTLSQGLEKISKGCFSSSTAITEITIPSSVNEIGDLAFNGTTKITKFVFNHPAGATITLPAAAGSSTGAFYSKSARSVSVYTDNETIKNYPWATDNLTATFYHLDGTAWT